MDLLINGKPIVESDEGAVLSSTISKKVVNTSKAEFDQMTISDQRLTVAQIESYFAALTSVGDLTNQAARATVLKMKELKVWEAHGVSEEAYFKANDRFEELKAILDRNSEASIRCIKLIHDCWGIQGLSLVNKGSDRLLDETLELVKIESENILPLKFLVQLTNMARRTLQASAESIYQLAQLQHEKSKKAIRMSQPSLTRANLLLTTLLDEANRRSSTQQKVLYTAEDRDTNAYEIDEKVADAIAEEVRSTSTFIFHKETWAIDLVRTTPPSKVQREIARISALASPKKKRKNTDPSYKGSSRLAKKPVLSNPASDNNPTERTDSTGTDKLVQDEDEPISMDAPDSSNEKDQAAQALLAISALPDGQSAPSTTSKVTSFATINAAREPTPFNFDGESPEIPESVEVGDELTDPKMDSESGDADSVYQLSPRTTRLLEEIDGEVSIDLRKQLIRESLIDAVFLLRGNLITSTSRDLIEDLQAKMDQVGFLMDRLNLSKSIDVPHANPGLESQ